MNTTISKFRWFWAWQDDVEEEWLGKMSAKGLHLISPGFPGIYTFSVGQPKDYVYRLDYRTFYKKDREEYLKLFRDAGWEYLGQLASWQYFRKEAKIDETPEIFTDTQTKISKYRRLITYISFFYIILGVILWSQLVSYGTFGGTGAIIWIIAVVLVFMTYAIIRLIMRIKKLEKY
jgi:hypothetical protein